MSKRKTRRRWPALIAMTALGAAAAIVIAEQVTVQAPSAKILDEKGSAGLVVESVPSNTTLEVLGHEGYWLHVRTPSGKEGYISQGRLDKRNEDADLTGANASSVAGIEGNNAGRGWGPEVKSYIGTKNLKPESLRRMEAMAGRCRGKALQDFNREGRVGISH